MFLFRMSLIGVYCNRLYDLREKHSLFSGRGRIKANTAGKNLNDKYINIKADPPYRQIGLPLNCSLL